MAKLVLYLWVFLGGNMWCNLCFGLSICLKSFLHIFSLLSSSDSRLDISRALPYSSFGDIILTARSCIFSIVCVCGLSISVQNLEWYFHLYLFFCMPNANLSIYQHISILEYEKNYMCTITYYIVINFCENSLWYFSLPVNFISKFQNQHSVLSTNCGCVSIIMYSLRFFCIYSFSGPVLCLIKCIVSVLNTGWGHQMFCALVVWTSDIS